MQAKFAVLLIIIAYLLFQFGWFVILTQAAKNAKKRQAMKQPKVTPITFTKPDPQLS